MPYDYVSGLQYIKLGGKLVVLCRLPVASHQWEATMNSPKHGVARTGIPVSVASTNPIWNLPDSIAVKGNT